MRLTGSKVEPLPIQMARRVQKTRSCSLSVVHVEQTADPIPPMHTVPIPADDSRIGRWIGRLQTKRPVGQWRCSAQRRPAGPGRCCIWSSRGTLRWRPAASSRTFDGAISSWPLRSRRAGDWPSSSTSWSWRSEPRQRSRLHPPWPGAMQQRLSTCFHHLRYRRTLTPSTLVDPDLMVCRVVQPPLASRPGGCVPALGRALTAGTGSD